MGKRSRERRQNVKRPSPARQPATPLPDAESQPRWVTAAIALTLALAVFAVYAQSFSHPFLRLDDPDYVLENPNVNSGLSAANIVWAFRALHASNWHPLTWISHMADVEMFGLDAGKHHFTSVALHAVNSVLLFFVLKRATRRLWPSAIVAALFALHPLRVESVAWVAERKDVLSALFFLITLWLWCAWVETREQSRYWLAVAAFAAGLMAKPMLVTLPFVLLLVDWWPLRRKIDRDLFIEKWPFFALTVASSMITLRAQHVAMGSSPFPLRIANALLSYVGYLEKTLWPADLSIVYPYRTSVSAGAVVFALCILAAVSAAVFVMRARFPFLITGWLWYLGTLVPVIGIVQVGHEAMADRYAYIPLIGIYIALVWLAATLVRRPMVLAGAAAAIVATLAACTFHQLRYWSSGITLFEHAVRVTGGDRHAREGLASELSHAREYARAASEFRLALAQAPDDDALLTGLGVALMQLGDATAARQQFESAVGMNPRNPVALRRLGDLELAAGRTSNAIRLFRQSASLTNDPSTLAVLAAARGNVDEAVRYYRRAIALQPGRAEIHNDLAAVLSRNGREPEALVEYEAALKIDPHYYEALMNVGTVFIRLERPSDAIAYFERAGAERRESPEPHIYLALVHARANRKGDAIREATTAMQINPETANLQFTNALHMQSDPSNLAGWIEYLKSK